MKIMNCQHPSEAPIEVYVVSSVFPAAMPPESWQGRAEKSKDTLHAEQAEVAKHRGKELEEEREVARSLFNSPLMVEDAIGRGEAA